ncbi:TraB family protein [Actinidia rufa]|uniref:TraB family protein n=1 Tax=Actinidia rufa TaxID=165716 RepID=A0A7J0GWR5_9ERIC|nr:TraB family protein [Actinidia rufa]
MEAWYSSKRAGSGVAETVRGAGGDLADWDDSHLSRIGGGRGARDFIFRAGIMYMSNDGKLGQQMRSNMFSLSGTGFFGVIGRSFNLGGQTALALRLLLAVFSSKISSDLNRPFGDEYFAWSLKRSKAVNNSKRVVGVIGKGHLNGVVYTLISDQGNLLFKDLVGKRPSGDGYSWVECPSQELG